MTAEHLKLVLESERDSKSLWRMCQEFAKGSYACRNSTSGENWENDGIAEASGRCPGHCLPHDSLTRWAQKQCHTTHQKLWQLCS